jgi:uncharacterized RDD family membrane protein YckC
MSGPRAAGNDVEHVVGRKTLPHIVEEAPMQYRGVGLRFLAQVIDLAVLGLVYSAFTLARTGELLVGGGVQWSPDPPGSAFLLVALAYFVVLEKVWGGTLGKKALGMVVVMEDGTPISWGPSLLRNILRIIDGFLFYLVGVIFVWTSPRKQRLGDRVGKTVVVKKGTERLPR